MSPISSSLPQTAHSAAQNALAAALNDPASKPNGETTPTSTDRDMDEGQEVEIEAPVLPEGLNGLPLNESARTVFDDPTTFNVKVRVLRYQPLVSKYADAPA